ncbi:hypothetical protein [Streptomyces sp. NPDC058861]
MRSCSGFESSDRYRRRYSPSAAVFSSAPGWWFFCYQATICRQVSP